MRRRDFQGRDLLTLMDYTKEEIDFILDIASDLKKKEQTKEPHELLRGRTVAMIFEKKSTRTRTSFQAGVAQLGAQSFYMRPEEMQLGRGEPIKDTARVIDRYCDALVIRTFGQEIVEEFARYMENPVINALTDLTHPCQALADLLTIREKRGALEGLKVLYTGDVWNVCHTWSIVAPIMGMDLFVARPKGYDPDPRIQKRSKELARASGTKVVYTDNFDEALDQADIVYANTWHSMGGPEKSKEQRIRDFSPFQVDSRALAKAGEGAIFMHPLPCYRGEEVTEEVIEGPRSVVWDQAENRLHTEKAVLYLLIR